MNVIEQDSWSGSTCGFIAWNKPFDSLSGHKIMLQKFPVVFSGSLRQILGHNFERDRSFPSFFLSVCPLISFDQVRSQTMNTVGAAGPNADGYILHWMQQWHNQKLSFGINITNELKKGKPLVTTPTHLLVQTYSARSRHCQIYLLYFVAES